MGSMVRIFNTACKEWWLPGYGSGMTKNIEEAWVLPLEQAESLTPGATVLMFEPVGPTSTTPDELDTARASEAMLREALEQLENEVKGMIEFREIALREVLGCTNVQVLSQRVAEAEAALSGSSGEWLERQLSEAVAAERERAEKAEATWRCFHCGFKTDDAKVAEAHFGDVDEEEPICRSWERMNADEKVGAFQGALQEIASEQEENSQLRSKLEKAEAERDGLAAALAMAERTINDAMASASVNNLSAAGGRLAGYQMCGRDYPAILLARDARITAEARRKALLDLGRRFKDYDGSDSLTVEEAVARIEDLAQEADHA